MIDKKDSIKIWKAFLEDFNFRTITDDLKEISKIIRIDILNINSTKFVNEFIRTVAKKDNICYDINDLFRSIKNGKNIF